LNDNETSGPSFASLFKELAPETVVAKDERSFWSLFADPNLVTATGSPIPREALSSAVSFDERLMFWAMRNLRVEEAVKHLLVIGCAGSGKSTLIQLFLQSIARRFRADWPTPEQLILFDGNCEAVTQLATLNLNPEDKNVYILNPFDERCAVWDIAEGAKTPLLARHLAALIVPEEHGSSAPFFWQAARDLVYAVILGLNRSAGQKWTFRDLICALDSKARILKLTALDPRAKVIAVRVFEDQQHAHSVLSTVGTKLVRFEPVAALWHSATNAPKFSIEKFLKHPGVLVLGNDPVLQDSIWPVNSLLLKALTQEILRGPSTRKPRHWFVLDEFPAMQRLDCINDLLRRGRGKGVATLLGTQGVEALYEIYGDNAADDIMGQCGSKTALRAGGPKTAEWDERFFGKVRRTERTCSESWSRSGGYSHSTQYDTRERSLFLASTFLDLPFPKSGGPFISISDVPSLGTTFVTHKWFDQVLSWMRPTSTVPAVLPRLDVEEQRLKNWSPEEEKEFTGKPGPKTTAKKKKASPKPKAANAKPYLPGAERRARNPQLPLGF
jgi:type IV secretory pathway TraG/TraD family ATPase VirD4